MNIEKMTVCSESPSVGLSLHLCSLQISIYARICDECTVCRTAMDELSMSPLWDLRRWEDRNEFYYVDVRCVDVSNISNIVEIVNWNLGQFAERVSYVPISHCSSLHRFNTPSFTLHPYTPYTPSH